MTAPKQLAITFRVELVRTEPKEDGDVLLTYAIKSFEAHGYPPIHCQLLLSKQALADFERMDDGGENTIGQLVTDLVRTDLMLPVVEGIHGENWSDKVDNPFE